MVPSRSRPVLGSSSDLGARPALAADGKSARMARSTWASSRAPVRDGAFTLGLTRRAVVFGLVVETWLDAGRERRAAVRVGGTCRAVGGAAAVDTATLSSVARRTVQVTAIVTATRAAILSAAMATRAAGARGGFDRAPRSLSPSGVASRAEGRPPARSFKSPGLVGQTLSEPSRRCLRSGSMRASSGLTGSVTGADFVVAAAIPECRSLRRSRDAVSRGQSG